MVASVIFGIFGWSYDHDENHHNFLYTRCILVTRSLQEAAQVLRAHHQRASRRVSLGRFLRAERQLLKEYDTLNY